MPRLGWLVAVVLLSAACASQPSASPDPHAVLISTQQAIDAVKVFVPDAANLTVDGPHDGVFHRFYDVHSNDLVAGVDAFDAHVMSLTLLKLVPTGNVVALTTAEAQTRAAAYLSDHHIPFDGLRPSVTLTEHGDYSEYDVTWQGYVGDIPVPDSRSASVDPSNGTVFAFSDFRRPYSAPPQPVIGRDDAIARAKASVSGQTFQSPTVDGAGLKVDFAADGTQLLVWEIGLSEGDSHVLLHVDALTGAVTFVGAG
jgi:hypothetical protein